MDKFRTLFRLSIVMVSALFVGETFNRLYYDMKPSLPFSLKREGLKKLMDNSTIEDNRIKQTTQDKSVQDQLRIWKEKDQNCFDTEIDWSDGVITKHVLNPDKFLIPYLYNGPTNQLLGFRQSIVMSLILNRTLILPPFYEHALLNVQYRSIVEAKYRISLEKLRRFVSVVPLERAVQECRGEINAVFMHGIPNRKRIKYDLVNVHVQTGLKGALYKKPLNSQALEFLRNFLHKKKKSSLIPESIPRSLLPINSSNRSWIDKLLNPDNSFTVPLYHYDRGNPVQLDEIRKEFNSNERCALYLRPFRQLKLDRDKFSSKGPNLGNEPLPIVYKEVVWSTQAPYWITRLAQKFREELISEIPGYLAVHWRFDKADFMEYLCGERTHNKRHSFCDTVRRARNASAIASAIVAKSSEMRHKWKTPVGCVYIAAPPSENNLLREIKLHIQKREQIDGQKLPRVISSRELKIFLEKYRDCDGIKDTQLSDTISQIEMDLCVHSDAFMHSSQSTWSQNAMQYRYTMNDELRRIDDTLPKYIIKVMTNSF